MFEELTPRANKIIHILAQEEVKRLNHEYLAPEHILLGLLKDGDGIAVKALLNLGVDLERLKNDLSIVMNDSVKSFLLDGVFPSARVDGVLKFASVEARGLGHTYIGTEHLLLGILREEGGAASLILEGRGVYVDKVRNEISRLLGYSEVGNSGRTKVGFKTSVLDEFARDLTLMAQKQELDLVIGRDEEIQRVIQVLCRRKKNNPLLIGDPGIGKTSIVEGLAQYIVSRNVPEMLLFKRLLSLDLGSIIAGTKYRGEFEERLKNIVKEILKSKNIILFIDEIHTIIGAGGAEGAIDAANMLKPVLVKGEFQCIGATTLGEYRKYIEKDSALERRFQSLMVKEPTSVEAVEIIKGLIHLYEAHHKVRYTEESIVSAVELSCRYISNRYLPDKAIDLIDEAGVRARLKHIARPEKFVLLEKEINALILEKDSFVKSQNYEKAAEVRDKVRGIKQELKDMMARWEKDLSLQVVDVHSGDIAEIISSFVGIPSEYLSKNETEKLLGLEKILSAKLVGQDEAVKVVSSAIRRNRVGLGFRDRPIGSFVFLGPTGVGKTELSRILAEFLFSSRDRLVYVDMSEFMERHSVSKLIGSPPGYVGYDEGGGLTEKIKRNPYSVVLFDEVEKAHVDVLNILLRILEEGQLLNNWGHVVNFRNTVIIMTSNIGSREISKGSDFGFISSAATSNMLSEGVRKNVFAELKKRFSPEFLNRVDDVVVFHSLAKEHVGKILDLMLEKLTATTLQEKKLNLCISEHAKKFLVDRGYDVQYGARFLRKIVNKFLIDPLSLKLLEGSFENNDSVFVSVKKDCLVFKKNRNMKNKRLSLLEKSV